MKYATSLTIRIGCWGCIRSDGYGGCEQGGAVINIICVI